MKRRQARFVARLDKCESIWAVVYHGLQVGTRGRFQNYRINVVHDHLQPQHTLYRSLTTEWSERHKQPPKGPSSDSLEASRASRNFSQTHSPTGQNCQSHIGQSCTKEDQEDQHLHAYVLQEVRACEVRELQEGQHVADVHDPRRGDLRDIKEPHHAGRGKGPGRCCRLLLVHPTHENTLIYSFIMSA